MEEMQYARPVEAVRPNIWPKVDLSSVRDWGLNHNHKSDPRKSARSLRLLKATAATPLSIGAGADTAYSAGLRKALVLNTLRLKAPPGARSHDGKASDRRKTGD
jgi:hypothetical protein